MNLGGGLSRMLCNVHEENSSLIMLFMINFPSFHEHCFNNCAEKLYLVWDVCVCICHSAYALLNEGRPLT